MPAYTILPGGKTVRWHADYVECTDSACPEYHVTKAELWGPDEDADRAHHYDQGQGR